MSNINPLGAIINRINTGTSPAKTPTEKYINSFSFINLGCFRNNNRLTAKGIVKKMKCIRNPIAIPNKRPLTVAFKNDFSLFSVEINVKKDSIVRLNRQKGGLNLL